jgi:hypothetical protein
MRKWIEMMDVQETKKEGQEKRDERDVNGRRQSRIFHQAIQPAISIKIANQ